MKRAYTRYDKDTGEILSVFESYDDEMEYQLPFFIEGKYSHKEFRIIDNKPVRKSDLEIEERQIQDAWVNLKRTRDGLLKDSDWTQAPDAPVDSAAWAVYRKALRDLPANTSDPRYPDWPTPP
jgi:hypothetical protein